MKSKLLLQKFFRGYSVLEKIESKINGQIEIREDIFGRRSLLVGGISQSGHSVEKPWEKPLKKLKNSKTPISNLLILGLGAGSVAKVIHNFFPKAKMTGVEIDPIMVKLGKKYFELSTVKNLEIRIADATQTTKNKQHKQSLPLRGRTKGYDLVLVDLYLGKEVPEKAKTDEFIKDVKESLSPFGIALFNRLYYGQKKKEANQFESRLKKIFSQVEPLHVSASLFFLCQ